MMVISDDMARCLGLPSSRAKRRGSKKRASPLSLSEVIAASVEDPVETRPEPSDEGITFFCDGLRPAPKERQRFGRGYRPYTPERTREFERVFKEHGRDAMSGCRPYAGPVEVHVILYFQIPKFWPKEDRKKALEGLRRPTRRPDLDNVSKAVLDSLNEVVYNDDAQVIRFSIEKFYREDYAISVRVAPILGVEGGFRRS